MEGYNPYCEGRWYRFFIESNGSNISIIESDIDSTSMFGTRAISIPHGYSVLNCLLDIHYNVTGIYSTSIFGNVEYNKGGVNIVLPDPEYFDYGYVYVFAKQYE